MVATGEGIGVFIVGRLLEVGMAVEVETGVISDRFWKTELPMNR